MSLSKEIQYAVVAASALAVGYSIYSYMSPKECPYGFIDVAKAEKRPLYKKEAYQRSQDVTDVQYQLAYALIKGGKTYHG